MIDQRHIANMTDFGFQHQGQDPEAPNCDYFSGHGVTVRLKSDLPMLTVRQYIAAIVDGAVETAHRETRQKLQHLRDLLR